MIENLYKNLKQKMGVFCVVYSYFSRKIAKNDSGTRIALLPCSEATMKNSLKS